MKRICFAVVLLSSLGLFITGSAQADEASSSTADQIKWTFRGVLITGAVAVLVGVLTFIINVISLRRTKAQNEAALRETKRQNLETLAETKRQNAAALAESKKAERRKVLGEMLNEFYGPLISYLNAIQALYQLFRHEKPKGFRTLTYLLDPDQEYESDSGKRKVVLSESDKKLLEEVIETEKKIEDLIMTKGGLVDDPELMFAYKPDPTVTDVKLEGLGLLAVAVTHFRVLRWASEGHFRKEAERFKNYVYPRELDDKVSAKYQELRDEIKALTT